MIDPQISATEKPDLYRELAQVLSAVFAGEPDDIANMANAAALLWEYLPDINWVGFYRAAGDELVLGPFQGRAACVRIPFGRGVCGTAAAMRATQVVEDVHAFPGHIACDAASRSEIVVPIIRDGQVIAVLDIDSPVIGRFDAADRAGCEVIAAIVSENRAQS